MSGGDSASAVSPEANLGLGRSVGWWGMVLFITSEALFFFYLIVAYLYLRFQADTWPPAGTERLDLVFPSINTVILIASGLPIYWARRSLRQGNRRGLIIGLILTILLGTIFLSGQLIEYSSLGFSPSTNVFGASFFTLTGFHGAHVLGGIGLLAVMLVLSLRGWFTPERHFGIEAAGMYWHFVDAVWIGLFTVLYVLQ